MEEGIKKEDFREFAEAYQQLKYVLDGSDICAFVARFFQQNPRAMDTLEGLTIWCFRRNPQGVIEAMMQLQTMGVVEEIRLGETKLYTYTKNPQVRQMVDGYFEALQKEIKNRGPFGHNDTEGNPFFKRR